MVCENIQLVSQFAQILHIYCYDFITENWYSNGMRAGQYLCRKNTMRCSCLSTKISSAPLVNKLPARDGWMNSPAQTSIPSLGVFYCFASRFSASQKLSCTFLSHSMCVNRKIYTLTLSLGVHFRTDKKRKYEPCADLWSACVLSAGDWCLQPLFRASPPSPFQRLMR